MVRTTQNVFVNTFEIGEELCIRVYFSFSFFIFHAKSATTNNLRIDLSDISYHIRALSVVIRTTIKKVGLRKTGTKFFRYFKLVKRASRFIKPYFCLRKVFRRHFVNQKIVFFEIFFVFLNTFFFYKNCPICLFYWDR